jgi:hypothetical protein
VAPEELGKAHDCSTRIHHLFAQEAKLGVACLDLYRLALKDVPRMGYPNDIKRFAFAELYSK